MCIRDRFKRVPMPFYLFHILPSLINNGLLSPNKNTSDFWVISSIKGGGGTGWGMIKDKQNNLNFTVKFKILVQFGCFIIIFVLSAFFNFISNRNLNLSLASKIIHLLLSGNTKMWGVWFQICTMNYWSNYTL